MNPKITYKVLDCMEHIHCSTGCGESPCPTVIVVRTYVCTTCYACTYYVVSASIRYIHLRGVLLWGGGLVVWLGSEVWLLCAVVKGIKISL